MFGAFRYGQATSELPDNKREYSRTACDICRARKLKCDGDKDECDRCIATSNVCTYTLSSGSSVGRKRLRRTTTATSGRPTPPSSSDRSADSSTRPTPRKVTTPIESPAQWHICPPRPRERKQSSLSLQEIPIPAHIGAESSTPPGNTAGPGAVMLGDGWPTADVDLGSLFNLGIPPEPAFGEGDFNFVRVSMSPPAPSLLNYRPPTRTSLSNTSSRTDLRATSHSTSQPPNGHAASLSSSSASSSSSHPTSPACGCLCVLLHIFEDIGAEVVAKKESPTDSLFSCLQKGIQKCWATLSCPNCDTSVKNPMLLATLANHLVALASEIVTRFLECESRDTVPTIFRFGRYSVERADMRTRLLEDMIALHIRDLQDVLERCKKNIGTGQGSFSMMEQARLNLDKLHKSLRMDKIDTPNG